MSSVLKIKKGYVHRRALLTVNMGSRFCVTLSRALQNSTNTKMCNYCSSQIYRELCSILVETCTVTFTTAVLSFSPRDSL